MKDLTKGKPSTLILAFALPIFLGNLLQLTQTVCGQTTNTPTVSAVIDYIGNKSGAVKGGRRAAAAPQ